MKMEKAKVTAREGYYSIDGIDAKIMVPSELVSVLDQNEKIDFPDNEIPTGINYILDGDPSKDPAKFILLGMDKNLSAMMIGPKGTGKTTTAAYIAQQLKRPLMYLQLTGSTGLDSFVGKWLVNKEGTYWVDGILTKAMKYGYTLVLDELNMALPEITAILHSVMDDRGILILDEKGAGENCVVKAHPDFRIIAAINPVEDYAGTKEMNQALMDRFRMVVNVQYPDARKERKIVLSHPRVEIDDDGTATGIRSANGVISRMVTCANSLRKLYRDGKISYECSTRNLIDWAILSNYLPIKEAARASWLAKVDKEEFKLINAELDKPFRDGEQWEVKANRKTVTKEGEKLSEDNMESDEEINF